MSVPRLLRCQPVDSARAEVLAQRLGLQLQVVAEQERAEPEDAAAATSAAEPGAAPLLELAADGLCLHGKDGAAPTRVDFLDASLLYRLRTSGRRQGLGQALGLHKLPAPRVVDATAGLGRDALLMAHLGCEVLMLERSPVVHALLEDGLQRACVAAAPELLQQAVARLQLQHAEAREWLAAAAQDSALQPDIVYLDPMFPPRNKSARVKKDIALLHELLGAESDFASLLQAARAAARLRVVVKRPGGKPDAALPTPSFIVPGKTAHFEVYVSSKASSMP
jgi:16S rRNA (guanine1516-N2)-methyltransferase